VSSPGSSPSRGADSGDVILAPGSSNVVDLVITEMGLPGYPDTPSPPAGNGHGRPRRPASGLG
jgi:hypothetical protein